jgi:hypothetical protein
MKAKQITAQIIQNFQPRLPMPGRVTWTTAKFMIQFVAIAAQCQ